MRTVIARCSVDHTLALSIRERLRAARHLTMLQTGATHPEMSELPGGTYGEAT